MKTILALVNQALAINDADGQGVVEPGKFVGFMPPHKRVKVVAILKQIKTHAEEQSKE